MSALSTTQRAQRRFYTEQATAFAEKRAAEYEEGVEYHDDDLPMNKFKGLFQLAAEARKKKEELNSNKSRPFDSLKAKLSSFLKYWNLNITQKKATDEIEEKMTGVKSETEAETEIGVETDKLGK